MKTDLQNLNMGEFSEVDIAQIETLLASLDTEQMPADFGFSQQADGNQNYETLDMLLENFLADHLASLLNELLRRLSDADPDKVFRPTSWLARITGKYLENSLLYIEARLRIDTLLKELATAAAQVNQLLSEISDQRQLLRCEMRNLKLHIAAGRIYCARENFTGAIKTEYFNFDTREERFLRRLTNLGALLACDEMTSVQFDLAYMKTADLLARYHESCQVLLPVWKRQTICLLLNEDNSSAQFNSAKQAYSALNNELTQFAW
jgi:hypothetical protein